jgi:N12 class adenine-specific DNA methylase
VARPPARRPSRRSRSGNANANQLSFFDPVGELQALHREERQLRTQKIHHDDHRRFLQEAIHNARDRVRAAEEDLARAQGWTGRSASEVVIARGGQPLSFTDRAAAGAALLAELRERQATLIEEGAAIGLGDMAGLEICVAVAAVRAPNDVVLAPAFRNQAGVSYPSADPQIEFTLDDDPITVIERFEAALGATPQALRQRSDCLAKARAELADYQQQLERLPSFSEDRLSEVNARIAAIEAPSGGLFQGGETAHIKFGSETPAKRGDHADDGRGEEQPAEPLRGPAQDAPAAELSADDRQHAGEGHAGGVSGGDRTVSGADVRADHRSDDRESRRNAGDETAELSGQRAAGGQRDGQHRHRLREAVERQEARWRERARQNFRIQPDHAIGAGTPKQKVAANIAAICIVKALAEEARAPTPEERAALVRYVGWGAFAQAIFDTRPGTRNAEIWREERQALTDLLTAEEWDAARATTLNAHYTSEAVINGIWSALQHLGFQGGRVIEPALGPGHFIGLTPEPLRESIARTEVEIDPLSGAIAKALYPGADIRIAPFESINWPDGFFDLAISNVPFGAYTVRDKRYSAMAIHDYFFIRSLDTVRAGGVVAFITSRYTLDKESPLVRKEIARRAEFLGAIRLPGGSKGAFAGNAGTDVTTDIIFLKRLAEPQAPEQLPWLSLAQIDTPDGPVRINRYFAETPGMMLGEMRLTGSMYSDAEPVLIGDAQDIDKRIAAAAAHLPAGAFGLRVDASPALPRVDAEIERPDDDRPPVKEGGFYRKDGLIFRRIQGVGVEQGLSRTDAAKLTLLIEIRDVVNELLDKQARGDSETRAPLRARLNSAYDAFHRRYGPINRTLITTSTRTRRDGTPITIRRMPNFAPLREDPDAYKVAAIEAYDLTRDIATKAAIFSHDIVQPVTRPVVTAASDALALSLNEMGRVDLELIAQQLGIDADEAVERLGDQLWLDPAGETWRTAPDYLSGDVVRKLEDALVAAETDERYARNVEALEAVQPAPLTRVDINVLCGAPWVPVDVYRAFLAEKLNLDARGLIYSEITKKWQFVERPSVPPSTQSQFGTARSSVPDIVLAALNNAEIRIMDPVPDASPVYNPRASEEAGAKVAEIREMFSGSAEDTGGGWVWENDERAARLEALYNRTFNRLVPTVFDGSHLTFPGMVRFVRTEAGAVIPFALRPHQRDAVWRVVASGNTLLDHAVGAGKTFTMIAAGMEQKRLGLIVRPMYVVPNHMLEQFSREFLQAYPGARLLVADKASMSRARRKAFAAKVAAERWDGVIITHDAFGRLRLSDDAYQRFIRDELDELREFKTRAAEEEGKSSPTVKDLERAAKQLEKRLADLIAQERKDDGVTFEELGVDFLFVDEAHAFKNLGFRTRHTRVKGLAASESQRATDLYLKIRYLEDRRPGRSVVFATGTPISNTIAEMYTMQRYLQLPLLRDYGLDAFDAWSATFGDIVSQVELAPNGRDYRTVRSFSRFVNIPELISLYSRVADTQTAEMLNLPRPKLKNGQIQLVEAEMSEVEAEIMASLVARVEAIKGKKAEKGEDNILKIMTEGLQLATDVRLLNPDAPFNPNGKIAKAVDNIHRIWAEGAEPALSQIVFLDSGVPGSKARQRVEIADAQPDDDAIAILTDSEEQDEVEPEIAVSGRFNLYEDLRSRLIERGIPAKQIAFIHDANTDEKKGQLFGAVRRGEIRILIGSTSKMGVGTTVQERPAAMHHLDAPWRPADVEQRDGRILRQGNLNAEVEIYRYITLRTLDAYRWRILTTKAAFIAQIRAGARGVRTASDIDSPLPEASVIKAAATGDPRIMEHAELSKQVQTLEASRRAYERSLAAAKTALERTTEKIARLEERIAAASSDAARILDLSGDAFIASIRRGESTHRFSDRKAAGEMLKRQMTERSGKIVSNSPVIDTAGEISGFDMQIGLRRKEGALQFTTLLQGGLGYSRGDWFAFNQDTDAVGLVRRFEGLLKSIPAYIAQLRTELDKAKADQPRLEKQIAAPAFAKQAQLDEAKAHMLQLARELQPQQKKDDQTMKRDPRNAEWLKLDEATKVQVRAVIAAVHKTQSAQDERHPFGEIYAYPHAGDGIAWGINSTADGMNLRRGILAGRELEQELARANGAKTTMIERMVSFARDLGNRYGAPQGHVGEEHREQTRQIMSEFANGVWPLESAIGEPCTPLEQNMNIMGLSRYGNLEPQEIAYLRELIAAGVDEDAFHLAFNQLRTSPSVSDQSMARIARGYTDEPNEITDRDAALGAIETHFYDQRRTAHQLRQTGGRSAGL